MLAPVTGDGAIGSHETPVRVLRVFTDESGSWGNPLGVIDGQFVEEVDRQQVARELAFSETIFIDDREFGVLRIFTPVVEIPSRATRSSARRGCSAENRARQVRSNCDR
jgi:hypothetical protein